MYLIPCEHLSIPSLALPKAKNNSETNNDILVIDTLRDNSGRKHYAKNSKHKSLTGSK